MKNVFISGASRGIGKGVAIELAKNGYNLALACEKSILDLRDFASKLSDEYHITAKAYQLDVGNVNDWSNVLSDIKNNFDSIDIVINNAGISYVGLITDMTPDEWQRIIDVNVSSLFYSTKAFLPDMIRKKSGKIINISSIWGENGASCEVAYSASKGAVNSYTKALAKEVAPSNISVNAISCGVIDTDMNKCFSDEEISNLKDEIPIGRLGTPTDVGQLALSIINSPTYMTGQIIGCDGGF